MDSQILYLPQLVWRWYVEYLWEYKPDSWVAALANSFRVFAVVLILPVIILTLLDITSYVIARTLGVVDDLKVPTATVPSKLSDPSDTPLILGEDVSNAPFEDAAPADTDANANDGSSKLEPSHSRHNTVERLRVERDMFFASEDGLVGVGVFSPAGTQPPSPMMTRPKLQQELSVESISEVAEEDGSASYDEWITLRKRAKQQGGEAEE